MDIRSVSIHTLEQDRNLLPIDIRPFDERYDGVGFIPGSLRIPDTGGTAWVQSLAESRPVVLVCLSGHRSEEAVKAWSLPTTDLRTLEGGTLAWGEVGYGLAGAKEALAQIPQEDVARNLQSCFVGHMAEVLAEAGMDDVDPVDLLHQCFQAEGLSMDQTDPVKLIGVLDRAALFSRQVGSSHETMARNMDMFLPSLLP